MTVIVDTNVTIKNGARESAVFPVPAQHKIIGSVVKISLVADNFPTGEVDITIFISTDNGVTFGSASMSTTNPGFFKGVPPHFWEMTYSLNGIPTHFKYSTNSPSQFIANVILEVF